MNKHTIFAAVSVLFAVSLCFGNGRFYRTGNDYWWVDSEFSFNVPTDHDFYRFWVPDTTGKVIIRGVILNTNNLRGDLEGVTQNQYLQKFARKYNFGLFATCGIIGDSVYHVSGKKFLQAFNDWASLGLHPELANVPFISVGGSNGGVAAYSLAMLAPGRTIACCNALNRALIPFSPSDAGIKVPVMMINAQYDDSLPLCDSVMAFNRQRGALWSHMLVYGMTHTWNHLTYLYYPFMENMINARLPSNANPRLGPVALNLISEQSGWLADMNTWASGYTYIAPYNGYTSNKSKAEWLPDSDVAFLYRSYSSFNVKLSLQTPNPFPFTASSDECWNTNTFKPGETITLNVNADQLPAWTKIVLYRGATKIDSIAKGAALQFNVKAPASPVCQSYTLLGYDGSSKIYPANPFTVIVADDTPYSTAANDPGVRPVSRRAVVNAKGTHVRVWDLMGREIVAPEIIASGISSGFRAGLRISAKSSRAYLVK
jgi:hypothetical protein